MMPSNIIWLTGESGAGKTTVARILCRDMIDTILLDGDEMRASISLEAGFSREDREAHNLRVARLAKILSQQSTVIVAVIAPMKETRRKIMEICNPIWVYIKRTLPPRENHFYDEPRDYFIVNHDIMDAEQSAKLIRKHILNPPKKYSLFIGRYQPLHDGHIALIQSVLNEGRDVLVALRDTPFSKNNPYSLEERMEMFKKAFNDTVKVIVIPDIDEVCYGRDVGWGIRQIRLPEQIEAINATEIRRNQK